MSYRLRVRFHGANRYSRWLYRHVRPLGWLYYRVVRQLVTFYERSDDDGRTWRRL